jgi:nucleotide-binding universal stress UspA family protein
MMFKHVLIPTDGSALSRKAAKAGIAFAKALRARVTAYHSLEMLALYVYGEGAAIVPSMVHIEKEAQEMARKYVEDVGKLARTAGVPFDSLITKAATPYHGIVQAARKKKCDVIFMASHGRGGLASLILGSTTQKVLAHSKLPVVVFR